MKRLIVIAQKLFLMTGVLMLAGCSPAGKVSTSTLSSSPAKTYNGPVIPFKIGNGGSTNLRCPSNSSCIFPSSGYPGICKTLPQPTLAITSEGQPKSSILPGQSLSGGNELPTPKTITNKTSLTALFRTTCQMFPIHQPFIGNFCPINSGWVYQIIFAVKNRTYARVFIGTTVCDGQLFADRYGSYFAFPNGEDADYSEVKASLARALGVTVKSLFN